MSACVGDRELENGEGESPTRPVICGPSTWPCPVPAASQPKARLHPVSLETPSWSCKALQSACHSAARGPCVDRG